MRHERFKGEVRSPLRYPGGKTRAIGRILQRVPDFREYREPMVGGGSVFLAITQRASGCTAWINDLNEDLYLFWVHARDRNGELVEAIRQVKETWTDGRALFDAYTREGMGMDTPFDRAVRFFVLNRISFSGTVDSGGYSKAAFKRRFTDSAIERVRMLEPALQGVKITNLDYQEVVNAPGDGVFIFLDPPYYSTTGSRLYGRRGDLHLAFDHERFARVMRACQHEWLVTYDDHPRVRELFDFAKIETWELQYGMNNYKQGKADKGRELFISNHLCGHVEPRS